MSKVKLVSLDDFYLQDSDGNYLVASDECEHNLGKSKLLIVSFDDISFSNEKIYQEGFELTESICSQSELRFGGCEASVVKLKIRNNFGSLQEKWLNIEVDFGEEDRFQVGKYKVNKSELSGDKKYANITAYDAMYDIINTNVVEWYDALEFPVTMKQLRDGLCEHLGIVQETIVLIQDDVSIEKTINADEITGYKVLNAICELNGVFGYIKRDGSLGYKSLNDSTTENQTVSSYQKCEYEDFLTNTITKVHIRQEENDIGGSYGESDDNVYAIEDNFLVYGKSTDELNSISEALFNTIKDISYRPMETVLQGDLSHNVGDEVIIHTKTGDVKSYVLERTLKGIQAMKDTFSSKGVQKYTTKGNSIQKDVRQLKGKTNVLERSVDETISKIEDVELGLGSEIVQNAQAISQTISEINKKLEDETNTIKSLQSTLEQKIDSFEIEFKQEISKVDEHSEEINELKKTSYKFDTEDLTIEKSGSEIKTKINEDGMRVYRGDEEMLKANNEGVDAVNLHAKTYLIVGNNSRFEDYGEGRTACFWIGN